MTTQLPLPTCVIPGCTTVVGEWGVPCDGCVEAFGPMLQHNPGGRRLTPGDIERRDDGVRLSYRVARLRGVL
ncbi:hypothetical protein KL864_31855 [Mycolicibacterium goodii]|uniref:hypothetical protein n=1 Tax=Mycolicibacterium goodii TaxID=134601 RepID=UPI001BDD3D8B|nr:hypothetical protein [Mycolicibacterium goodii]MBU8820472.1 hypothetical protein [Mycolicibacterium goodii]